MNKLLVITVLAFGLALSTKSLAQELDDSPPPAEFVPPTNPSEAPSVNSGATTAPAGKRQKLNIGFDDELIKGKVNNPEVDYLFARKQFNFKKLIKLREDFIPEVQKGKVEFGAGD